ncbi:uncharacterized protein LOC106172521 isoform X2 [Lingula anatina]|uniref:Uncharacterized protein LOC106172521 isoform X1 n=1 Tax=Lingula anatina TaxID=7574 RepID=A0A1S3JEG6_LINAN|nr:uncharacterized protein LOC106172521 isoform X1 [Lingula anatina]XP_013408728.1 uncharacterized protein LOC106172521 isoform X2 [Lingula anatina]|eukprot:XP_013408727.1 uncharacterized protein LOC106172521 isoform X1 [Lingula anatina]
MSAARRQVPREYGWDNNGFEFDNHGYFGREQDIEMRNIGGQSDVITEPPSTDKPVIEGRPGTKTWYANIRRFEAEYLRQKIEKKRREKKSKPKTKKKIVWDVIVRILSVACTAWDLYADWSFYLEPKSAECGEVWSLVLSILASVLALLQLLHLINETVIDIRQRRSNTMDVKGLFGKRRLKTTYEIFVLFCSKIPQGILPLIFHCFCDGQTSEVDTAGLVLKLAKSSAVTDFFSVFLRSLETDARIWFDPDLCCKSRYFRKIKCFCCRMVTVRETGELVLGQCCFVCCLYEKAPDRGCHCSMCFDKCRDICACECDFCRRDCVICAGPCPNPCEKFFSCLNRLLYLGSVVIIFWGVLPDLQSITCPPKD